MELALYGGAGRVFLGFEEGAVPLAELEEVSLRVLWPGRELAGDWEGFPSKLVKGTASVRVSALGRLVPEGNPLWRAAGGLGWFEGEIEVPEGGVVRLEREPLTETLTVLDSRGEPVEGWKLVGGELRFPQSLAGQRVRLSYAFEAPEGFKLRHGARFSLLLVFQALGGGVKLVRLKEAQLVSYEELYSREDFSLTRMEFAAAGAPEVSVWKG